MTAHDSGGDKNKSKNNITAEDADSESESPQNNSTIAYSRYRARSLTSTMPQWSPRRSSTPKCKKKVRFKPLTAIMEQESGSENIRMNTGSNTSPKRPLFADKDKTAHSSPNITNRSARSPIRPLPLQDSTDKRIIYSIPTFLPLTF